MFSENLLIMWLAYSAAAATLFLASGTVAVLLRRQPVERLRIIQWTLLACLLAPLVDQLPGVPRWSLAVATNVSQPIEPDTNALPDARQPKTTVRGETPAIIAPQQIDRTESRLREPTINKQPIVDQSFDNTPTVRSRVDASASSPSAPSSPVASVSSSSPLAGEGRVPAGDSPWRGEGAEIPRSFPWARIVLATYAVGVGAMLAWYLLGLFTLVWLNATARAVPDEVAKQFRADTSDPAALRVRLCMHPRVELPLAYGLIRPTILLPESMCTACISSPSPLAEEGRGEGAAAAALRYSLLHEWSHLARGDVWRWRLSTIVGILFFYQPLFWWLRRQQRLSQDFLADSHAATASLPLPLGEGHGKDADSPASGEGAASTAREDYAQFLVNLAHRRLGLSGALALSIGDGRSNLYRRVTMLLENRQPLAQQLRWPRRIAIAAAAIAMIAATSAIRLTAEDAKPAANPTAQAKTSEPKPATDATKPPAANAAPQPVTDATAKAEEKAPSNAAKPEEFTYTGTVQEKDPSAPSGVYLSEERSDFPGVRELQKREQLPGKPIVGANVRLQFFEVDSSVPPKRTPGKELSLKSDAQGKFTFSAPADKVKQGRLGFTIDVSHPRFVPRRRPGFPNMLQPPDAPATGMATLVRPLEIDMLPAKSVSGIVVSPDGKPIAGVALHGYSRPSAWPGGFCYASATSDEQGKFETPMTATGGGVLWIQPANGFIPMREEVGDKRGDLGTITLQPGITLKGRLLNAEGTPRPGVEMWAERRDYQRPENAVDSGARFQQHATTDAKGDFTFAPVPPGEYRIDLSWTPEQQELRSRYVSQTVTLAAGQEPAAVEMRERFDPSVSVPITGHVEINKQMLDDVAHLRELVRGSQMFGGIGSLLAARQPNEIESPQKLFESLAPAIEQAVLQSNEVDSSEKVLQLLAPTIRGTNNGVSASAKGEIDAEGNFTIHAPRGLQQAVIELAGTRMLGLAGRSGASLSRGSANSEESRYFQPQWRLANDKPWTRGIEIVVDDIGNGIGGIEVKYPPTEKLRQFTADGRVLDESTGQPIAGVKIIPSLISIPIPEPIQLPEVVTDATGRYTVAIPVADLIKRAAKPGVRVIGANLHVDVKHPNFASPRPTGNPFRLSFSPVPSLQLERFPSGTELTTIYMRPGKEVTGTLQTPNGKPAAGITVDASTLAQISERLRNSQSMTSNVDIEGDKQWYYADQVTDEAGRFKFVLPTDGEATLRILPKDYAILIKEIHDQRGDLGVIKLETGHVIKWHVDKEDRNPPERVFVMAKPVDSAEERKRPSIAHFSRETEADANGNFELAPLGAGDYRVEVTFLYTHLRIEVAPKLTLVAGQQPAALVVHQPATVNVEGQVILKRPNTSARTARIRFELYEPKIAGKINGLSFVAGTSIDAEGKFIAKVPKGATDVQVQLANSQGPQVRAGKDKPLVDPGAISLGTVNEDVHGVEIVYP